VGPATETASRRERIALDMAVRTLDGGVNGIAWAQPMRGTSARVRPRADVDLAMERYAAGDDAAFALVYDAIAPRLHGYLLRQTRERARAEDLVQQTMLHIHRARARFIPGAEVTPWAFAIARRLLLDGLRRARREGTVAADDPDSALASDHPADEVVQARELARRIAGVLAKLPESQRVAFELLKHDGLTVAEAAEVLGTTSAAVKLRAHRAYEALRLALGDAMEKFDQ
jgi:RNA polymerase sigma-70 factor (ECF subfamily)